MCPSIAIVPSSPMSKAKWWPFRSALECGLQDSPLSSKGECHDRFISYLASFFILIDLLIIFLGFTNGITLQMIIAFPIVTLLAWQVTRISNNRKAADEYRRRYHDQVAALRALQDEQGTDKVRTLRPMV